MRLITGRSGLDTELSRCLVHLQKERCRAALAGSRVVTMSWDPGTYSNKSWNIGIIAALDKSPQIACDLIPKVCSIDNL